MVQQHIAKSGQYIDNCMSEYSSNFASPLLENSYPHYYFIGCRVMRIDTFFKITLSRFPFFSICIFLFTAGRDPEKRFFFVSKWVRLVYIMKTHEFTA